jgi:HPt (histidine-containing phosphotransfer) domain-containing protein
VKTKAVSVVVGLLLVGWLAAGLWRRTQSVNPEDHAHIDAALRELRSLDRTINQDVLRARYQLIDSYDPVMHSYRRVEELEAVIARPPRYLDDGAKQRLSAAVAGYRASVTAKQSLIETFKYRTADLRDLLGSLPGAGAGLAKAAADAGDDALAASVNHVLQQTLLYNLTSEEKYAPVIRKEVDALAAAGERTRSYAIKRRIGSLVVNIHRLLGVKPSVDRLLRRVFEEPVIEHEERVAHIYYEGYAAAEGRARGYRVVLYGVCILLIAGIAYTIRRLQHSARALAAANERLEERVAERTRELDARNRETRVVLDNVDQALFTVDLQGRLSRERSAALARWFPRAAGGATLGEVFEVIDPETAPWMTVGWDQLVEGMLPQEVALDQLPRRLAHGGREYEIEYRPVGDGARLEKVLFLVSDVTEIVERKRREADQQEQLLVFQEIMKDGSDFEEFCRESERLVAAIEGTGGSAADPAATIRALHTLKGNAAMYGVRSVAGVCHELEAKLVDGATGLDSADRGHLDETWQAFARKVRALTAGRPQELVELTRDEIQALRQVIGPGKDPAGALRLLTRLARAPVERRLAHLADQAARLGRRLGKGEVIVTTEANGVRLDASRWAPFWSAFVHMLRNALDHGIEPPEERARGA